MTGAGGEPTTLHVYSSGPDPPSSVAATLRLAVVPVIVLPPRTFAGIVIVGALLPTVTVAPPVMDSSAFEMAVIVAVVANPGAVYLPKPLAEPSPEVIPQVTCGVPLIALPNWSDPDTA